MIRGITFIVFLAVVTWVQMKYLAPVSTKKEWGVYLCAMVIVACVGTSLIMDWNVPNPIAGLRGIVEPIGKSILH